MNIWKFATAIPLFLSSTNVAPANGIEGLGPANLRSHYATTARKLGHELHYAVLDFCDQHRIYRCVYSVGPHLLIVTAENRDKKITSLLLRIRWKNSDDKDWTVGEFARAIETVFFMLEGESIDDFLSKSERYSREYAIRVFKLELGKSLKTPNSVVSVVKTGNHIEVSWRISAH